MTAQPSPWDEGREVTPRQEPALRQSAADAAQVLEQALTHFESALEKIEQRVEKVSAGSQQGANMKNHELTELKRALREIVQRLEEGLDHLGLEAQRLSDEGSRLAIIADRLEAMMDQVTGSLAWVRAGAAPVPEPVALPPEEPQFLPDDNAMQIALAAVPGFQGLMDAQRALSGLSAAKSASVVAYKDGEALLEVMLREPVGALDIVEGLREATGHGLLIEEARPDALRLRLRFTA